MVRKGRSFCGLRAVVDKNLNEKFLRTITAAEAEKYLGEDVFPAVLCVPRSKQPWAMSRVEERGQPLLL